jgi:hypothetical protein
LLATNKLEIGCLEGHSATSGLGLKTLLHCPGIVGFASTVQRAYPEMEQFMAEIFVQGVDEIGYS